MSLVIKSGSQLSRMCENGASQHVRTGALGGECSGPVTFLSLACVSVLTDQKLLKVPNCLLLAAAGGPREVAPEGQDGRRRP
jgi:hypothetical protein